MLTRKAPPTRNRFIAARNFSRSTGLRQDCVLIESDNDDTRSGESLWVAKILCLMHIHAEEGEEELAFVQYFDIIPAESAIDRVLNCVRLRWARRPDDPADNKSDKFTKWFDMVPVGAIRGTVHVASIDYKLHGFLKTFQWYERRFYVNRFYYDALARLLD